MCKMFLLVLSISFIVTGCSMIPSLGDYKYKAAAKACEMSHDSCVEKNEQGCAGKKLVCDKVAEESR